jgi:large subunit ribosomal protein L19
VDLLSLVRDSQVNPNVPALDPGDVVKVHLKVLEGDRERVQIFQGTVIRVKGRGMDATFTVRRIAAHRIGVERTFLRHSPRLEKVEVVRKSRVRRARLYYLRGRAGRSARLKEVRPG